MLVVILHVDYQRFLMKGNTEESNSGRQIPLLKIFLTVTHDGWS